MSIFGEHMELAKVLYELDYVDNKDKTIEWLFLNIQERIKKIHD